MSTINGYPETFSVFCGDPVTIRVARKAVTGWKGWRATHFPPPVTRIEIRDAVRNTIVTVRKPSPRPKLTQQSPVSYRDEGAGYALPLEIDTTALPAGIYECIVHDSMGDASQDIYFNLKPRSLAGYDLVCVLPSFTWQAYNRLSGGSFYSASLGPQRMISTQRPLHAKGDNSIAAAIPFLTAFTADGVRSACVDSADLHDARLPLGSVPVMAILTHDEYWSVPMRTVVDRFVRDGGGLLVLAGNTCWWQITVDGHNLSVDKSPSKNGQLWYRRGKPGETTFVSSYRFGGYSVDRAQEKAWLVKRVAGLSPAAMRALGSLRIVAPEHPVFSGVTLEDGNRFGGDIPVVYREVDAVPITPDGQPDTKLYRTPDVTPHILATGHVVNNRAGPYEAGVVVEADVGAGHVLNMGSFGWSRGLRQNNEEVKRIVLNAYRHCRAWADKKNQTGEQHDRL
ncbi:MAG TPA: N,N-dimethylformamidase beta subunit family domain-containing protein [Rhizomicrobium sp.]